jgi:hypothetical protein
LAESIAKPTAPSHRCFFLRRSADKQKQLFATPHESLGVFAFSGHRGAEHRARASPKARGTNRHTPDAITKR